MGLMRSAAVKGLIPAGSKVTELRQNLIRLMSEMSTVLDERLGAQGLEAISEVFRRLGSQDAKTMSERLGLGSTLRDAVDAWLVIGHVMGARMVPKWVSKNRVETTHPFCPQYESFKARGKLYCGAVCLPYVGAVAEGICPGIRMEVVRPADENGTCVKALSLDTVGRE
ncbi:MAG: hypothetical protein HXY34_13980 [Candidatus Thorarchaeota archaeon]|nr:hypothetical protein [Candidatus Thorarchaeota archaeon]